MTQPVSDERLAELIKKKEQFCGKMLDAGAVYVDEHWVVNCLRELQSARQELAELREENARLKKEAETLDFENARQQEEIFALLNERRDQT